MKVTDEMVRTFGDKYPTCSGKLFEVWKESLQAVFDKYLSADVKEIKKK